MLVPILIVFVNVVFSSPLSRRYNSSGVALYNNCNSTIYKSTVTLDPREGTTSVILPSTWYSEQYILNSGAGVSIKLSRNDTWWLEMPITQLEYNIVGSTIGYDLSNVNCGPRSQTNKSACPFLEGGMFLATGQLDCPTRVCESGVIDCSEAYMFPSDDSKYRECPFDNVNLVLYMCSSEGELSDPTSTLSLEPSSSQLSSPSEASSSSSTPLVTTVVTVTPARSVIKTTTYITTTMSLHRGTTYVTTYLPAAPTTTNTPRPICCSTGPRIA